MSIELIALIVFVLFLTFFLILKRKKIEIQKILFPFLYFILYKTKIGLKLMDKLSKKEKFVKVFNFASVFVGFLGMAAICFLLGQNLYKLIFFPSAVSGVGLVLPIKVKGAFYVPFFYWIISILVIASIHEFCHGLVARYHNIKVKSSGFAFLAVLLPIIPAAFVEPDEKQIVKKKPKAQMQIFAAGPFSNLVLGFAILGIFALIANPIVDGTMVFNGANITSMANDSVLLSSGVSVNESIIGIDNSNVTFVTDFSDIMDNKTPGSNILLKTDKSNYSVVLGKSPKNASMAYLGVSVAQNKDIKPGVAAKYGYFIPDALIWILGLLYWLYLLNIGIGIFNLVPVGPIDGGRMLLIALEKYFKKDRARKIAGIISLIFLLMIVLNVLAGFIR